MEGIETVSNGINLICHCQPSFCCTLCKSHIAELVQHKGIPCQLWCGETRQFCDFPNGAHYWIDCRSQEKPLQGQPSNLAPTLVLPSALKMVFPLASEWKTLGVMLKARTEILDNIEHDYKKAHDCLREMLSAWLKNGPQPSWQTLAEAVELFNESLAKNITDTYCAS